MLRVLVVDDEFSIRHMLKTVLTKAGYEVEMAEDGDIALQKVRNDIYDIVLCDIKMPQVDGFSFLEQVQKEKISSTIIMMTSYGSIDTAVQAIRKGAHDYISKPFNSDEVIIAIKKAEERQKLIKENELLKREAKDGILKEVIVESQAMKEIMASIEKIAPFRQPVLITGESGVGKEIVARLIHQKSNRANNPFVAINCAAIPENLLESELFGYAKGAFTDASQPKRGLLEYAHEGVCFLDEISEMKENLQSKLLRFLEDGEIRRVGDLKTIKVDVRIISATNRDLKNMIESGKFRQDLYYRLNVIPIQVPPLRERKEDIEVFIKRELEKNGKYITDDAMGILLAYRWPGNFREMKNFLEKTIIFASSNKIDIEDLPEYMFEKIPDEKIEGADDLNIMSLKKAIEDLEKSFIKRALQVTKGNRLKAAKLLEISPRSLHYKIKDYNIE